MTPNAQKVLHAIFRYRLVDPKKIPVHATIGSAAGALSGVRDDSEHKLRNTLVRMLAGGAGLSLAPFAAQRLMGRVATNLVLPYGYSVGSKLQDVRSAGAIKSILAVLKDKPIYVKDRDITNVNRIMRNGYTPREVPYRQMFGLKPRAFSDFYQNRLHSGTYRYNPSVPEVREELARMTGKMESRKNTTPLDGNRTLLNTRGGVPGNVVVDNRTGRFVDVWDFDLSPNERISKPIDYVRGLLSMITKPVRITSRMEIPNLDPEF